MDAERWQRIWAIFHDALERPAGRERESVLDDACGADAELRAEVESLLAAHDDDSGPEPGPRLAPTLRLAEEAPPGSAVGPYRIVRRIGEGGMGVVYEARQLEPVRRSVALKLIKAGMDTREVVRRFEAERQALALMDHSSIARVYEAGATEEGRPYFAMELVDGLPLTQFCDSRRLDVRERVALFATVCRAVHSAHQKGVIHRDLKSSNVLVAAEEGGPVPKIIDFGVARAVQGPQGESMLTGLGALVGTPETMSPEQAAMSLDLDTRTDIYSLGALLYDLLTGKRSFDFQDTPLTEVLRRIREDEPPPPSARYGAGEPDAEIRAALRGGGRPAEIARELRGELDWIVARAMAKERDRRYSSAADLAADLERFLEDQPVAAGPPSRLYRARKFLRRHRIEVAAATTLLIALAAFAFFMAAQSRRLARALEVQERERATANQVSAFLVDLLEQPDPAIARGEQPTVRDVVDRGVEKIEKELGGQPEIQAKLLQTIGRVQNNLGEYDKAATAFEKALEIRQRPGGGSEADLATALYDLGDLEGSRSHYARALELGRESLEIRRRVLPPGDSAIADSLDLVGVILRIQGDYQGAIRNHQEALAMRRAAVGDDAPEVADTWNLLGIVKRWSYDTAGAEAAYRKAYGIFQRALGADHPKTLMTMNNLALVLHVRGDHEAARKLFEEGIPVRRKTLGNTHPDVMLTLANYGKLLHDMGLLDQADAAYREAIEIGRKGVGEESAQMANQLADYSGVLSKLGRTDEALASAREARQIRARLFGPESAQVAAALVYVAKAYEAAGDDATAALHHAHAIEIFHATRAGRPRLGEALETWGLFLLRTRGPQEALAPLEESVAILRDTVPPDEVQRARAEGSLGLCLLRLGRLDEARPLIEESLRQLSRFETAETRQARERFAELEAARAKAGGTGS